MPRYAVLEAPGIMSIRELPNPRLGSRDALLKVAMCGVCGSDPILFRGQHKLPTPTILGHEIVGTIAEISPEAEQIHDVKSGDYVVVEFGLGCGYCRLCRSGNWRLCRNAGHYGGTRSIDESPGLWGAYGEYLYLPAQAHVHKIDREIPPEAAVMACAVLGNGIRWTRTLGGLSVGDVVAIIGPGPQGLACVIAAKEAGASRIVVVGLSQDAERLRFAAKLGATDAICVDEVDPVSALSDLTGGEMAKVVVDVSGSPKGVQTSLDLVGRLGTVVSAGANKYREIPLQTDKIVQKEVRFQGAASHDTTAVLQALEVVASRKYPLEDMVTHRFPLEETERAIRAVGGEGDGPLPIKAVVIP